MMFLLSLLAESVGDQMRLHYVALHTILSNSMRDPSNTPATRLSALQTLKHISEWLTTNDEIVRLFHYFQLKRKCEMGHLYLVGTKRPNWQHTQQSRESTGPRAIIAAVVLKKAVLSFALSSICVSVAKVTF